MLKSTNRTADFWGTEIPTETSAREYGDRFGFSLRAGVITYRNIFPWRWCNNNQQESLLDVTKEAIWRWCNNHQQGSLLDVTKEAIWRWCNNHQQVSLLDVTKEAIWRWCNNHQQGSLLDVTKEAICRYLFMPVQCIKINVIMSDIRCFCNKTACLGYIIEITVW